MNENPYENYYNNNKQEKPSDLPQVNSEAAGPAEIEEIRSLSDAEVSASNEAEVIFADDKKENVYSSEPYSQAQEVQNGGEAGREVSSFEWNGSSVGVDTSQVFTTAQSEYIPKKEKKKKSRGRMSVAAILILCVLISSVAGAGSAFLVNSLLRGGSGITINQVTQSNNKGDYNPSAELSTVEIVDKYADSVVEIITESVKTGVFAQQFIQSGAGSGVIIDSKGYIVTNHHVIDGARKISVTLRNGESYDAQLVGSDVNEDLALLKIEAEELTAAVLGNSDNLRVGQRTIAIGNPLGQLGGTVTEGIISALDRDVVVDGQTMNLLQTDTAINPGNSGGGMFDGNGNLIGIVVAKSSGSEVEGLGFAIPINDAIDILSDLMDYGYVRGRIAIGMEFIDVTSDQVAWMYGLSETGCYVYSVDPGSNAEEAGFKSGDLILKVDSEEVETSDEIEEILKEKNVGDKVKFDLKRGNNKGTVTLELEEYVPDTLKNSAGEEEDDLIDWFFN
ncbi:MAG: trypsin-like peptidase domain-containing protein [Ruminococcus sp.]|nr:trypsin-like peptidase domain-containing protein [Ruminococcus sp.]